MAEAQSEEIDKVLAFTEWLLGDIYGCLAESSGLNIEFVEQDDDRCVPEQFFLELMSFSKPFVDRLTPYMLLGPVLLFYSEIFFLRFTNPVCLKLIKDGNQDVHFLKVMAFLLVIIRMCFEIRCYRPLDDIPGVLYMLLNDDLKTKFYEVDRFGDILSLCDQLKKDKEWYKQTVQEIRGYVKESLDAELAFKLYDFSYRPDICTTKIADVKSERSMSDSKICPYCETECILLLKGLWKPKKGITSQFQQM